MTAFFNRTSEKEKRRELRKNMPAAEVLLWSQLRGRQLMNCKFRRQYSVGPYLLDFHSTEVKLGIELDGDSHFQEGAPKYDRDRQQFIESFDIKVIRFLNTDVLENMDGVLMVIAREIEARRGEMQPPPAPPL